MTLPVARVAKVLAHFGVDVILDTGMACREAESGVLAVDGRAKCTGLALAHCAVRVSEFRGAEQFARLVS